MVRNDPEEAAEDPTPGSDPFVARLPAETQRWQDQGILTAEQARAIAAIYDLPTDVASSQKAQGRLVTILAIFGSLLVGLGVILFFAANWDQIPRAVRLALLLVGIPGVYGLGYRLKYVKNYRRVGTAMLLLAAILYGVGIHLIAQIYNFPVNDPWLMSLWFLGVAPLAYLTRSRAILVLTQGLFLVAIGFWLPEWLDGRNESPVIFAAALYLTIGLLLYGLGKLQSRYDLTRPYAAAYEVFGLIVMLSAVYFLSFRFLYDASSYRELGVDVEVATQLWVLFYLAGAGALAAIAGAAAIQIKRQLPLITLPYEGAAALTVLAMAYLVVFVGAGNDVLYPVLFNLLLLAGIIGLVFAGYFWRREIFINIALVFFGLDIITRYFELSWDLLDRSVVFIVAGLILLGGGFLLEQGRIRVVNRIEAQRGVA